MVFTVGQFEQISAGFTKAVHGDHNNEEEIQSNNICVHRAYNIKCKTTGNSP